MPWNVQSPQPRSSNELYAIALDSNRVARQRCSSRQFLHCAAVILATMGAVASYAAEPPPDTESPAKKRSPWLVLPVVSSNPKLGTTGGFLTAYLHNFDAESRVSLFGITAQYTTTHSLIGSLFARTSFGADHHRVNGIVVYGNIKNDYDDYLGTGQPLKTNDDVRAFGGRYMYRFKGDWFAGGQALLTNYQVFGDSVEDDLVIETLGVKGFKSGGLGAVMMHDSRDNQDMPTRGWYANFNNVAYHEWLGGDNDFDVYRLDTRAFWEHGGGHVFGLRQFNQITVDAPGAAQATVQLRGYKMGQYLAKNMSSLEVEERFHIAKRWGATLFVGGAWLYGGETTATSSEGFYPSYGGGFQFIIKPVQRMLANLEYAYGNSDNSGIYLKLGYAW